MIDVQELIASTKSQTSGQEMQPKDVIATNAQIREHIRQLKEDSKELDRLFQKERNKRKVTQLGRMAVRKHSRVRRSTTYFLFSHLVRHPHTVSLFLVRLQSKFSPEELEMRGKMVSQMMSEIQELKELSLAGYIRKKNNTPGAVGLFAPVEESDAFRGPIGNYFRGRLPRALRHFYFCSCLLFRNGPTANGMYLALRIMISSSATWATSL